MGRADAIPSNAEPGVSPQTIDTPETGAAPAAERAEPQGPAGPALFVVGIGASAGGLEALRPFVANLPIQSNMAYIVAQHLSPQHRSMMVQLLGRETALPVVEAADGMMIEADTIYVTPPNRDAAVCDDGRLSLRRPSAEIGPKPSINHLLASLARTQGERAVGVILSGTGSDGAHGVRAIKAAGGIAVAQEPGSAKYDMMPKAAIASGGIDLVLTPPEIARQLSRIAASPRGIGAQPAAELPPASLQDILERIRRRTRLDFANYKEPTIGRQIDRRMATLQIPDLDAYVAHIEAHPDELDTLSRSFLISVTSFFRDRDAFGSLKSALAALITGKTPGDSIRVWVPGCATGEEAYSIAILLAEMLGEDLGGYSVQVFGTDIDTDATNHARRGIYAEPSVEGLDPRILSTYFAPQGREYVIDRRIRDLVVFARHDLAADPPFLRTDLISCRNVLIYFKPVLQERVLKVFHFALARGGLLFLGKSEAASHGTALFDPVPGAVKVFRRRNVATPNPVRFTRTFETSIAPLATAPEDRPVPSADIAKTRLLESYAPPSILVRNSYDCVHVHGNVTPFLQIAGGRIDLNLLSMIHPQFRTDLRALLHKSRHSRQPCHGQPRRLRTADGERDLYGLRKPVRNKYDPHADTRATRPLTSPGWPSASRHACSSRCTCATN